MEFFHRAKAVRLRSQHGKFLAASDDEESVKQQSNGASAASRWAVEVVEGKKNTIRLKSSHTWKYLAASDEPFLLGLTGKRVIQASPRMRSEGSVEWEPLREGGYVKLRSRRGSFLRANGTVPPWRNSITHDLPSRTATQDWVVWMVEVLEIDHTAYEEEKVAVDVKASSGSGDEARMSSVYSDSKRYNGGGGSESPGESVRSARTPSPQRQVEEDSFSRTSSTSSYRETPPAILEQSEHVSPYVQALKNDSLKSSKLSDSLNSLESAIANADQVLSGRKPKKQAEEQERVSKHPSSQPSTLVVRMAKQVLIEAQDLDFESLLSSGRLKRVEKAISVLSSYDSTTRAGEKFKMLKTSRERAIDELNGFEVFKEVKAETKAGLQREVGKARELQKREAGLCEVVEEARRRREELLRELERVEAEIKEAEAEQAENEAEIEEVCGVIERKSKNVKEMEMEENVWVSRKDAAERKMEEVEEDWVDIKLSLLELEC